MIRNYTYVCFDCRTSRRTMMGHSVVCPECNCFMTKLSNLQKPPKKHREKEWKKLEQEIIKNKRKNRQLSYFSKMWGWNFWPRIRKLEKFGIKFD